MVVTRQNDKIPVPYANLKLYTNLSQFTLQKRRNLNMLTKTLRPKEGVEYVMDSMAKGLALLDSWGIIPDTQSQNHR